MKKFIYLLLAIIVVSCNIKKREEIEPKLNISELNYEILEKDASGNILDIRFKNLHYIPNSVLDTLEYLQYIRLIDIDSLTEEMGKLNNLKFISIHSPNLNNLPESMAYLKNLQSIVFYSSNLKKIPISFESSESITSIVIEFNPSELISSVSKIKNLEELYIKSNVHDSLPTSISQLVNLKRLSVDWVAKLPKEIGDLPELETFEISVGHLVSIPTSIGQLKKLKSFTISYNEHKIEIPNELSQCINLELININTPISHLPVDIGNLQKIKIIRITNTNDSLLEIPESINKLSSLIELHIYNNKIEKFPQDLMELTSLEEINLSNNNLIELPEFCYLPKLYSLSAPFNNFKLIPESIRNLTTLKFLNFSNNAVEELPLIIEELTNLESLNLNYNKLTYLPINSLVKLKKLRHLYIVGNQISEEQVYKIIEALPNTQVHY